MHRLKPGFKLTFFLLLLGQAVKPAVAFLWGWGKEWELSPAKSAAAPGLCRPLAGCPGLGSAPGVARLLPGYRPLSRRLSKSKISSFFLIRASLIIDNCRLNYCCINFTGVFSNSKVTLMSFSKFSLKGYPTLFTNGKETFN